MSHGGNVWQGSGPLSWQDHSANIRPEGPPDWVRDAMVRGIDNVSYYPEPNGSRAAKGIADFLGIPEEYTVATAGGISAIDMATGMNGGGLLLLTPCFTEYADQANRHKKPIRRVSILREDGVFDLTLCYGSLFDQCCVWLCNPMNPSGKAFSRTEILELLTRVEAVNGYLFVDEAFIDYCRENSVCSLIETHPNLVIVGSMTKSLGIPGVRLGYICGWRDILDRLSVYRRPWEVNCFAESIAMDLPNHRDELRADARINAARREYMVEELQKLGVFVYDSQADFLLCRFSESAAKIASILKSRKILVRECMDYDMINDDHHLRVAVKTDKENENLIKEIGEAMKCAANL